MMNDVLKEALRLQNERAARMQVPDDMEQRVMQRITRQHPRRHWGLYVAAASVALVLTLAYLQTGEDQPQQKSQEVERVLTLTTDSVHVECDEQPRQTQPVAARQPRRKQRKAPSQLAEKPAQEVCVSCEMDAMEQEMMAMINEFENM